ncbi:MAG: hypothetical protein AAGA72_17640 [Pseudomonadota bacterium]
MKSAFSKRACGFAAILALAMIGPALADNPLLQQNESLNEASSFEARAKAIDLAATKAPDHPVCQNIRANYDEELAKIVNASQASEGMSMSQINQYSYKGDGVVQRLNRINRNATGNYSESLGRASNAIGRGAAIANDAAEIGGMFGLTGKMSQKKAEQKVATLDAQALDAVEQTECPMSTFN